MEIMSYDIRFKVKVEGADYYMPLIPFDYSLNTTWNVHDIIVQSTGLEWQNEANNGFAVDIIPKIKKGLDELIQNPHAYKHLEPDNGWGSVEGVRRFFHNILHEWKYMQYGHEEIKHLITFWIE